MISGRSGVRAWDLVVEQGLATEHEGVVSIYLPLYNSRPSVKERINKWNIALRYVSKQQKQSYQRIQLVHVIMKCFMQTCIRLSETPHYATFELYLYTTLFSSNRTSYLALCTKAKNKG